MDTNRATVVVTVGGREVSRRQVRVSDGDTLTLDLQARDVADAVGDEMLRRITENGGVKFRATGGKGK